MTDWLDTPEWRGRVSDPLTDVIADALWVCQCDECAPTREAQASAVATLVREYMDREKEAAVVEVIERTRLAELRRATAHLRPQEGSKE